MLWVTSSNCIPASVAHALIRAHGRGRSERPGLKPEPIRRLLATTSPMAAHGRRSRRLGPSGPVASRRHAWWDASVTRSDASPGRTKESRHAEGLLEHDARRRPRQRSRPCLRATRWLRPDDAGDAWRCSSAILPTCRSDRQSGGSVRCAKSTYFLHHSRSADRGGPAGQRTRPSEVDDLLGRRPRPRRGRRCRRRSTGTSSRRRTR